MLPDQAQLTMIGRAVSLQPAELGERFHKDCTITIGTQGVPSIDNGWSRERTYEDHREFWYDVHPTTGERVFLTLSGFAGRIQDTLTKSGFTVNVTDVKPDGLGRPDFSKLAGVAWRGRQQEVFIKIMARLAMASGVVVCPTGWGKSFMIAQIAKVFPEATIVITEPNIDIAREVHASLSGYFRTGIVGGGKHDLQRVTVAVINSVKHCSKKANLVIVDEAHTATSPMHRQNLLMFERAKFLGLTATPEGRSDGGDAYLEALFGSVIAEVGYQEAVEGGNVVQLTVVQVPVRSGTNVTRYDDKYLKDKHGIWRNPQRNAAVKWSVDHAVGLHPGWDPQILIMVQTTEHAYALKQILPDFTVVTGEVPDDRVADLIKAGLLTTRQTGPESEDVVVEGLCSPKDRELYKQEFSAGKLRRAIATFVWSKGVNFLDLNVLIRADGQASDIQSGQVPGRLSRLGTDGHKGGAYLYDFMDFFSSDLEGRSNKRFARYRRNGWNIRKLT